MRSIAYGLQVGIVAWFALTAATVELIAVGILLSEHVDPLDAVLLGFYLAARFLMPTLGIALIVGVAGWAWAGRRSSTEAAPDTP